MNASLKTADAETSTTLSGTGIFVWAIFGVVALLGQAIFRLTQVTLEAFNSGLMTTTQWMVCGVWVACNCYMEGHRGFHLKFVPRVLARAHHLAEHPQPLRVIVAPLFAMAFFSASKRAKAAAWGVTVLVLLAIWLVRSLDQPLRGIIDAGVVAGLAWGTTSLLIGAIARLAGKVPSASPQLD